MLLLTQFIFLFFYIYNIDLQYNIVNKNFKYFNQGFVIWQIAAQCASPYCLLLVEN